MITDDSAAGPEPWTDDRRDRFRGPGFATAITGLVLMLVAPLFVSRAGARLFALGLPGAKTGDEPHYLVLIHSIINDGDFDLSNNYRDVHRGGPQAGRTFAGAPLDHHVNWYEDGKIVKWWQVYEMESERWAKDPDGHPVPTRRPGTRPRPPDVAEYSQHPVGLAVLLAPVAAAFRGTRLVEPVAIACSALATAAGCLAWCRLVGPYARCPAHLVAAAAVAYLGSPLWYYGLVLYPESFLACLAVAALAAALRGERYWAAGVLLGLGILIKAPFGLFAVPLVADALLRWRPRQAAACALPVAMAAGLVLYWNRQMYGDWLNGPQAWEPGSLLDGLAGLAFSTQHGLLWFSPAVCLSAFAVPRWFRDHRRDAALMTCSVLLYGGLMAKWELWGGGTCYSARLIVPVVPFLFAPLPLLYGSRAWQADRLVRVAGTALMMLSIAFGAIAAFGCDSVILKHPVQLVLGPAG